MASCCGSLLWPSGAIAKDSLKLAANFDVEAW